MSSYTTRPTAAELIAAVADFLDTDVRAVGGQVGFHARVAANVLRIVERELLDNTGEAVREALAGLGFADEESLAQAIRAGQLGDRADDVVKTLQTLVRHRLSVDHPGYDRPE
ncbi:DUF6285 domain-containing protein [Mycolicibacterium sp. BiH015]|uniref:DUF6285 domain-containing protein n=1 Tax=Mycolicibacterium sp. BiH015 TaxID=3018808 RepID=UPI0022E1CEF3|nr:DUF6285 domain-containing protein [Mycolicibacterium sp. BiH015]MDA2893928.1 DUF6285 domain-containing protein [Mycolicibacterium sp. BiH015]